MGRKNFFSAPFYCLKKLLRDFFLSCKKRGPANYWQALGG